MSKFRKALEALTDSQDRSSARSGGEVEDTGGEEIASKEVAKRSGSRGKSAYPGSLVSGHQFDEPTPGQ
jgi:hypothetical protein